MAILVLGVLSPGDSQTLWYIFPSILLMQIIKKDGSLASQLKPQEAKEPPPPGNAPETVCGPSLCGSFQELSPHPVDPVQGWYPAVKQGQGGPQRKVEEDGCT